ncbi:MAG: radical SAM protein [Candidatus Omnitrophota bacterium]
MAHLKIENTAGRADKAPTHPLGKNARILLTSVFGPYAQDDAYGSRAINPMELFHNQVTRLQGPFSLRMFHRSFGLLLLQENIEAPCAVLDFPSYERFQKELRKNRYDVVGISSILSNAGKVSAMCTLIRRILPEAKIVVGGHLANLSGLSDMIDADFIVKGDGIRWFREYLGQDTDAPVRHPAVFSGFGSRILGFQTSSKPRDLAAALMPSVGCPMGCNFCSTSHLFGGKGRSLEFYATGDELFKVMDSIAQKLKTSSFFIFDENFLAYKKKILRLLQLMEEYEKSWSLYIFSSVNVIRSYSMDELVRLGVKWLWMGIEGQNSLYEKIEGADTRKLIQELREHGISVLGSSIIGLEEHSEENLDEVIDWAVSHQTDFHQFMLYTALPGTPLHREKESEGSLLSPEDLPFADSHGQYRFNHRHATMSPGKETGFLLKAFQSDLDRNGPSIARMIGTLLSGHKNLRHHPAARVRKRILRESAPLAIDHAAVIWALREYYKNQPQLHLKLYNLLEEILKEFGWISRIAAPILGRFLLAMIRREEARLRKGWTYEPPCFFELNTAAKKSFR